MKRNEVAAEEEEEISRGGRGNGKNDEPLLGSNEIRRREDAPEFVLMTGQGLVGKLWSSGPTADRCAVFRCTR